MELGRIIYLNRDPDVELGLYLELGRKLSKLGKKGNWERTEERTQMQSWDYTWN